MKVGAYHDGPCDLLATYVAKARRSVGDYGLAHQIDTFSGCTDDLHTGGILQEIYTRDCPVTWSASLYRIRPGSQVYGSILEEFPKSNGNTGDDEHYFSSTDRWPVREDYTGFKGHAASMCPGS